MSVVSMSTWVVSRSTHERQIIDKIFIDNWKLITFGLLIDTRRLLHACNSVTQKALSPILVLVIRMKTSIDFEDRSQSIWVIRKCALIRSARYYARTVMSTHKSKAKLEFKAPSLILNHWDWPSNTGLMWSTLLKWPDALTTSLAVNNKCCVVENQQL